MMGLVTDGCYRIFGTGIGTFETGFTAVVGNRIESHSAGKPVCLSKSDTKSLGEIKGNAAMVTARMIRARMIRARMIRARLPNKL